MRNNDNITNTRGIDSVQEEYAEYINNIADQKEKVVANIVELVDDIEHTYDGALTELSKQAEELDGKRVELVKTLDEKKQEISGHLDDSIETFNQNYLWAKTEYPKSLILHIFLAIFLLFGYDPIAPSLLLYISSLLALEVITQNVGSITFVLKMILFLALSYYVCRSFQSLLNLQNTARLKIFQKSDQIKLTDFSVQEIPTPETKHLNFKSILTATKGVSEDFILQLGKLSPFISGIFNELNCLAKYQKMVDSFEMAMSYYKVVGNRQFFSQLRKHAPADTKIVDNEEVWQDCIVDAIGNELMREGPQVTRNAIMLLYREHNGLDTNSIFRELQASDSDLYSLSNVLIHSNRLTPLPKDLSYQPRDIYPVLKTIDSFNLQSLNEVLARSLRIYGYLVSYLNFLSSNNIETNYTPTIEYVVTESMTSSNKFEQTVIALAYKIGKEIFQKEDELTKEFIDGFARASVTIKYHNEIGLSKYACNLSNTDEATTVIKAYLDKAKELDRTGLVSLKELIDNDEVIVDIYNNRDDYPFLQVQNQLTRGQWYDSTAAYMVDLLKSKTQEVIDKISEVRDYSILKEIVKDTFQNVQLGTIERAIDSQLIVAYVILFCSQNQKIAGVIDRLSIRNLKAQNSDKRWVKRDGTELDIEEEMLGVRPKYNFMQFSDNSRIGILREGESFVDFKERFFFDLKTSLRNQGIPETSSIGIVILRITPSKTNFGCSDEVSIGNVDYKSLDVAYYIARLAVDTFPSEKLAGVLKTDKDVNLLKIIHKYTIYELLRIEINDISNTERRILEKQDLKDEIIAEIHRTLGIKGLDNLAFDLKAGRISNDEVTNVVRPVLQQRISPIRANILAKRFTSVMRALVEIYEMN
jgi:hypothetical protein